jgi:hypothetical protein
MPENGGNVSARECAGLATEVAYDVATCWSDHQKLNTRIHRFPIGNQSVTEGEVGRVTRCGG